MSLEAAPIDPLSATQVGVYRDDLVEVRAVGPARSRRERQTVRTLHFDVTTIGDLVRVDHVLVAGEVDDDLAGLLAGELFGPGWLRGAELFERIFTGVVLTTAAEPLQAWELFYRATLRRVEDVVAGVGAGAGAGDDLGDTSGDDERHLGSRRAPSRGSAGVAQAGPGGGGHGTIAEYAPVYAHAEAMLRGRDVVELGCCFGFLSIRLALAGWQVTASDVSAGTVGLLDRVAVRLGARMATVVADAARYPAPTGSADTVLVLHLLEHLDPDHGDRVVSEALRLARRRVVVAVPFEAEAEETWGHVRTVTVDDLHRWGRRSLGSGRASAYEVHEHHGGWLVLDR